MSQTFTREVEVRISEGDGRTLISRLVPYNEVATVNDGTGAYQEEFLPGAFSGQMRAANRIKAFLNFRHRQSLQDQIGYARTIEDRADGLHGELHVLENPDGDKALQLVEAGMLDRLSIEFEPLKDRVVNGVTQRVKARLVGVALVPQGAYAGAEVLGIREEDDEADPPADEAGDEETPAAANRTAVELPPPLDVERLEALGIDTKRRAFKTGPWDGSPGRWPDAASYCNSCLVDNNPSGAEKTKDQCHFPVRDPGSSDYNVNALRAVVGGRGAQASFPGAQQARERARRLLTQYNNQSGGN